MYQQSSCHTKFQFGRTFGFSSFLALCLFVWLIAYNQFSLVFHFFSQFRVRKCLFPYLRLQDAMLRTEEIRRVRRRQMRQEHMLVTLCNNKCCGGLQNALKTNVFIRWLVIDFVEMLQMLP